MNGDRRRRASRSIARVFVIGCSFLASVMFAEVLLRLFYPQKLSLNVTQWDPYVGFSNIPGLQGYSATRDYVMHVTINSQGLRDREIDYVKPRNVFRIGIFGDSFTFGEGVQNSETYAKVLEGLLTHARGLSQDPGTAVEVLNFGIGKTGTSHQLAFFRKEGTRYHLDLIVLGFLAQNDFDDNWSGVFHLKADTLVHNVTAYSPIRRLQRFLFAFPFYKWAATHSHFVNLFRKVATIGDDRMRMRRAAHFNEAGEEESGDLNSQKVQLTATLIEEFNREAMAQGSKFMLVNLPAKAQRVPTHYGVNELIPAYVRNSALLLGRLGEKQIRVFDLVPEFAPLPVSTFYFVNDGHMTKLGHQAVARSLHQYLLENRLVPVSVSSVR